LYVRGDGGVQLYYEDWWKGKPVLFLHGRGMSHEVWQNQVHALQDEFRLITLDLRGQGDSEKVAGPYTHHAYAADLKMVIRRLKLKDLCLVGWSTGSIIIQKYAQEYGLRPLVKCIVLVGTASVFKAKEGSTASGWHATQLKPLEDNFTQALWDLPNQMLHNPSQSINDWLLHINLKTPLTVLLQTLEANIEGDYRTVLPRIDVPALILQGKHDRLTPIEGARYMAKRIPNSRLVEFSHSGHPPHLEEPKKFNAELRRFLRDNLTAG
jgi:pimeloyl-ACP methyl ester carboxylesterase